QVDLWDLAGPRQLHVLYKDRRKVTLHPDGSSSFEGRVKWTGAFGQNPRQLAFSADSRRLAIVYDRGVVIHDVSDGMPVRYLVNLERRPGSTRSLPTHCVAFSPDGRAICYGGGEGRLNIGSVEPSPD